jgi:hypothetical protein
MSTNKKPQSPAKNNAKSLAPAATPPAGAATVTSPVAGDLSFDLGHPDVGPTVVIQSPNAANVFADFQKTGSVEIEASALMPGIACPFTLGCAEKGGKVRILSDVTKPTQLDDGRTAVQRVQQFHCRTCNQVAKGVKPVGGVAVGGPRLFNRLTGKGE